MHALRWGVAVTLVTACGGIVPSDPAKRPDPTVRVVPSDNTVRLLVSEAERGAVLVPLTVHVATRRAMGAVCVRLVASPGSIISPFELSCDAGAFMDVPASDATADMPDAGDVPDASDATGDSSVDDGIARLCLRVVTGAGTALTLYRPRERGEAFTLAGALYDSLDCTGVPLAHATLVVARTGQPMDASTVASTNDVPMDATAQDAADVGASNRPSDAAPADAADVADAGHADTAPDAAPDVADAETADVGG